MSECVCKKLVKGRAYISKKNYRANIECPEIYIKGNYYFYVGLGERIGKEGCPNAFHEFQNELGGTSGSNFECRSLSQWFKIELNPISKDERQKIVKEWADALGIEL